MNKLKLLGVLLAFVLVAFWLNNRLSFKGHPTDQDLTRNFQSHKADFSRLLRMFVADKPLGRVAYDFTRPENPQSVGISQDRVNEYRVLFDTLGLTAGIEGYDTKDIIWFYASIQGLSVTGSRKGYVYLKHKPTLIVANLDEYRPKSYKSFTAYKPLEGNWYLYFDYEN